jgi:hypothetical protein
LRSPALRAAVIPFGWVELLIHWICNRRQLVAPTHVLYSTDIFSFLFVFVDTHIEHLFIMTLLPPCTEQRSYPPQQRDFDAMTNKWGSDVPLF